MNHSTYLKATGIIFLLVAIAHLYRILNGTKVVFGSSIVPTWASWVGVIVAGYLAYQGLRKK